VRTAVHTVVLVSERLRRYAAAGGRGGAVALTTPSLTLPHMPPELWLEFASFFRRSPWAVGMTAPAGAHGQWG
jgi:hypothetical protein